MKNLQSSHLRTQILTIDQNQRANIKHQKAMCLWLTGLSGSGKSTLANQLERTLHQMGKHTYLLDGDNIRQHLNKDLGFTESDREENIRRISEVAKLMVDAGLIVIVAFISPYQRDRQSARALFNEGDFIEIYMDTPLEVCESRDEKGLYAKARAGQLANFTGISAPYEKPINPEITIDSSKESLEASVEKILTKLQ